MRADQQAQRDGYHGPMAVVELFLGDEPEPDLGSIVQVAIRKIPRSPGIAQRPQPRHVVAFAALCDATLACVPSANGPGARPDSILATMQARGVEVGHRRFRRALVRLLHDGRVERAGRRVGKRTIDATYRRFAP